MPRLHRLLALALLLALLAGCGSPEAPAAATPAGQASIELTVFAAASLTDAYRQIGASFEQANPGVRVVFNFAGSQQLAAQLGQGAPADVFASANANQMSVAVEAGRVARDSPVVFAKSQLVVITAPSSEAQISRPQDLARPGLKIVLAAEAVPVGRYSLEFLDRAAQDPAFGSGYRDAVLQNVVSYEDNVRSVLAKVALGEGDAGIVYVSDVVSSSGTTVNRVEIPANLNILASYPIAPISDSKHADVAQRFVDYMFTDDTRAILARYGFTLP